MYPFIVCIISGPGGKRRGKIQTEYCLSSILFDAYSSYLAKESLEGFEDFKIEQAINTVKFQMTFCYWLRQKRCYRA